ncbi:MAG TPA: patatin-like phospholipase family protein [Longimicrobiales bacterium]
MQTRRVIAACALLLSAAAPLRAQDALVLSGGGSRGLAHVGVLLRLEELGYDPDIVVGNSMGAVIGALYAAGYAPTEIRRRVQAVEWNGMFSALPMISGPGQTAHVPMLSFDLNVSDRRITRGLFGEWRINRTLTHLLFDAGARARGDFDRLPRRFRALATDLTTGEAVLLGSGDIARAVRASMAYPGFFAPVDWQGRLLVDGGIVDNLPTLEARQLGAQRIVAVDATRPSERIESRAPLAVVQRALNLMQINLHRDTIPADAFVGLDIDSNFSGASFPDDPEPLMRAGYTAAVRDLAGFAVSHGRVLRASPHPPDSLARIIVEAPDEALHTMVANAFGRLVPGRYDADAILETVDRLYASGLFQGVWASIADSSDTGHTGALHVRADAGAPITLAVAAGYDNDRGGHAWASLDHHVRYGRHPGVRTVAASFAPLEQWAALSTRMFSLSHPGLAFGIGAHVQEREVRSFGEDVIASVEVWRAGGWIGIELPIAMRRAFLSATLRVEGIDPEDAPGESAAGPLLRLAAVPPTLAVVGEPLLLEGEMRWGGISYSRFAARGSVPLDLARLRIAILADVRGTSRNAPIDEWPALGDQHAVPGLRWGELRGRHRAVVGIDAAYALLAGYARVRMRTGAVAADLDAYADARWVSGGEIGMIWPIPLGVLQVGVGVASQGDGRVTVGVGRDF